MNTIWSTVLAMLLAAAPVAAQEKIEAITRPSEDRILAFVRPGRVATVHVKDGQAVQAGQEVMRLDDEAEAASLTRLKAEAEDETRVLAAEAQLAQRKVDLRKIEKGFADGVTTEMEVEHARLDVTISELSLKLAQFQKKQAVLSYKEAQIQLTRMRLVSPIDGVVEGVAVEEGESADALEKVIRIVKIDPLWVDVPTPLDVARRLAKGGPAEVEFGLDTTEKPIRATGKIIHVASVADSASATRTVRVEVANAEGRPAGEHVYVTFPKATAARGDDADAPRNTARRAPTPSRQARAG